MSPGSSQGVVFFLNIAYLAICCAHNSQARVTHENGVKSKVYLSPKINLSPGSVSNKYYYDIEFPKGHIAIKSFNVELVDEAGNPVSLHETYLHHLNANRYYQRIGLTDPNYNDLIFSGNAGLCNDALSLSQFFGIGSESRKTSTRVPDPYGIEVGNPLKVPDGYEEKWMFNIHAIDTRGAVDSSGCTECRCHLYNVTEDEYGRPLNPYYEGGFYCCYDGTRCKVINGFESVERIIYLKYTVKWVDWNDYVLPVIIYRFDVTDSFQYIKIHDCSIEYDIKESTAGIDNNDYTSTKRSSVNFPVAGDFIYGVAHQHSGGTGAALYGKDGRLICLSKPLYGKGNDVGDEVGHVVGMSACYPKPGSMKIAKGEVLTLESNYSSEKSHTGVMGIFHFYVAESCLKSNDKVQNYHHESKVAIFMWGAAVFGLAISSAVLITYQTRKRTEDGYQSIAS